METLWTTAKDGLSLTHRSLGEDLKGDRNRLPREKGEIQYICPIGIEKESYN